MYVRKRHTSCLRLTIRKIHSLIDVPILEGLGKSLEDRESTDNGTNETRIISWQEKVFSHYEKDYYRIKENCKTDHHKKYYQKLKAESHTPQLLFTYVDEDNYYPEDRDNRNHRQQQQPQGTPSKTQSMYLMADLGHEVLLFTITWCPDERILTVFPDFNLMTTNPFYHEMRESNLHMYHYALERCILEKSVLPKPAKHFVLIGATQAIRSQSVDRKGNFDMPKQLHRNLLFLLEIVSASDFKYDGIHIRYRFELPADVKMVNKDSQLAGSTHASKQLNDYWHFSHCHELLLNLPDSREFQHSLEIYFEAIAIDDWCRERYLG
uniref:Uncharacterized protein n=1 Tax=Anopheles culicifacies TaxID=139723 RepID=A0A182MA31_9DIPT